ncbi:EAL domain-containing protein [Actinokineospora sp. NBRC 105648]|uniref:putative bifunctional diguanylate cyclase/phosphodiesterase n=1 Tax=Actinokineospora sp. NBRC 105648 TaxID=3032206 RepID=UPI0025558703|nr:EAL domain-containing protein [Actinokineospora sp. NBRC 105648]
MSADSSSSTTAPADGDAVSLRRIRTLTEVFSWFNSLAVATQLLLAGTCGRFAACVVLVALVLWVLPRRLPWVSTAVEGAAMLLGCLALPAPNPMVGLLFAFTMRRALDEDEASFAIAAVGPLVGYLAGLAGYVAAGGGAGLSVLGPALFPLVGLMIGAFALRLTVMSARRERSARRDAQDAQARTAAILRASPVGLVLLDSTGESVLSNDRARRLLGDLVPCPHSPDVRTCATGCLGAVIGAGEPVEVRHQTPDGVEATLEVSATALPSRHGGAADILLAVSDISARKSLENRLRTRAERDDLTGLANRAHFSDTLAGALRDDAQVALLLIDLDGFKQVNDVDGHAAGDEVLIAVARRVHRVCLGQGLVARLGGDEFAVLAPGLDTETATKLAEAVLTELRLPLDGRDRARASVGLALATTPGTTGSTLLRDADAAMYTAKRAGGDRVAVFGAHMHVEALARKRLRTELRSAIVDEQFVLHYQPIVDLATGTAIGAEALVRWLHPSRGLLPPDAFVALAEESDLIIDLGDWVLRTACAQAARWHSEGRPLDMSVNVSARQLLDPAFPDRVTDTLADSGLPAGSLTLELTEYAVAHDSVIAVLSDLRSRGVRVALDDFGTGYSSLNLLRRHPFDVIKIDRSFTGKLEQSSRTTGIVACVLALADTLRTPVVCEGVETSRQATFLRESGCPRAQGYLFGRPIPAEQW